MFSLIITIISIALVAALALATIYYGGTAFSRGGDGARAAQLINEGQQVNGAVTLARADVAAGDTVTLVDLQDLVDAQYLAQVPASFDGTDTIASGSAQSTAATGVCTEVNNRAGNTTPAATVALSTTVYGCLSDGVTFFYKF